MSIVKDRAAQGAERENMEQLIKRATDMQARYGIISRLDIQFNYMTGGYSARVWFGGKKCFDLKPCAWSITECEVEQ